jgi:hypothetical protein
VFVGRKWRVVVMYLCGWGIPLICAAIPFIFDDYTYLGAKCWIKNQGALASTLHGDEPVFLSHSPVTFSHILKNITDGRDVVNSQSPGSRPSAWQSSMCLYGYRSYTARPSLRGRC